MKRIWEIIGIIVFWLAWPALRLKLRLTTRTRMIIQHNNQVLVVKNWLGSGKWSLPGGGVKINEDSLTAVLREVKEEVGIAPERDNCSKVGNFEYHSDGLSFVYSLYKVCLIKKPKIKTQKSEITIAKWIDKKQLNKNNSTSDVIQALKAISR